MPLFAKNGMNRIPIDGNAKPGYRDKPNAGPTALCES